ncbi:putative zinc ribbon protein [Enterobacter kobei]|uniref:putative zinc ribbon protein n=1 Tax=Enterobacter kobei TaxID=208224 RepID=UPI0009496B5E|nr:putative zinc ribbon protein [Enterobacter kobei]HAV1590946.1 hypothetical protein [Enterobacter hormaechei subsp. xiangfangensis]HAV1594572.1 hypothetical protein [Enterobacter hormaechei subsp. xiangfangensis]HAV2003330.1 hypothetical protein [Enterobacter hormaechei subsp. xiangfangensis]
MYHFVFAPEAVTRRGEWITPETVEQKDYDSLFCVSCKLKIGVHVDPLTSVKSFVHQPREIQHLKHLKACRFNRIVEASDMPKDLGQDFPSFTKLRLRQATVVQNWHCVWCQLCWHSEKCCPLCKNWIFAISCRDE